LHSVFDYRMSISISGYLGQKSISGFPDFRISINNPTQKCFIIASQQVLFCYIQVQISKVTVQVRGNQVQVLYVEITIPVKNIFINNTNSLKPENPISDCTKTARLVTEFIALVTAKAVRAAHYKCSHTICLVTKNSIVQLCYTI